MKIICLGNYPPRQCGIATFTENLVQSILKAQPAGVKLEVMAMNDGNMTYDYPAIVKHTIRDNDFNAYINAAEIINQSGADILLLQHEYGIFGGVAGVLLLQLLRRVNLPIIASFHTVLEHPDFHQREVLKAIASYCSKVIVMNGLAIPMLKTIYEVSEHKLAKIEHGVPDFEAMQGTLEPAPGAWKNKKVLLTFGLIGRSKGLETVIHALPAVINRHPDLLYVILGKTHPHIIRNSGEEYRNYLKRLVTQLKLDQHVMFIDRYVSETELASMLQAADIYITPYLNKAQITSGTLSYAAASGCAVISTPYWHAEELLADDRGILFPFQDSTALAASINSLLDNPERMRSLQQKAYDYGKQLVWPKIGQHYWTFFKQLISDHSAKQAQQKPQPEVNFKHLKRLTMKEGLLQHASDSLPAFEHGFAVDDNARAIIVMIEALKAGLEGANAEMLIPYLSFLKYMQKENGSYHDFLSFDRKFINKENSEDAFGRAFWASGMLVRFAPDDSFKRIAQKQFYKSLQQLDQLNYARGFANCIFGLFHYIKCFPDQEQMITLFNSLANKLIHKYELHKRDNWHWYEDALTYDNGLIPAALYMAYAQSRNKKFLEVADQTRLFLEDVCFKKPWLSLVGNKKWRRFDDSYDSFAQQPIDATAMVILYLSAYEATGDKNMIEKMIQAYQWYHGENDLGIPVYDEVTKTCNDGIEMEGINLNKGAESNLAYLLATMLVSPYRLAFKK